VVAFGIFALGLGVAVFLAGTAHILIVLEQVDVVRLLFKLSFLAFTCVTWRGKHGGQGRKPGASSYTRKRLSVSLSVSLCRGEHDVY
jgi:hypothetical protein